MRGVRFGWIGNNIIPLLILAAFISGIITYITIAGSSEPLQVKPKRVWVLLAVNITLLTLLVGAISFRIYKLWAALKAESAGSKLQKKVLIVFSVVTILPTIIVSIFSALFFNLGIQTWFNERVQTAVNESLAVAEAYLGEHKENIRADAIAMAGDLSRVASLAIQDPAEFDRIVVTQSALRVLTESIVIQRNRIIAQGRFSFALAFEHIPQDALERAKRGEAVLMPAADEPDKVRALVRIEGLDDGYLLIGRLVDSKVIMHMQNAQGAVSEYEQLQGQLDKLQTTFSIVFISVALLLLFASIGYGTVFAARLTNPISKLALAAERVRSGDFSARVEDAERRDEFGMLARSFNRMTEQLDAQRGELIEANRRLDERRRFSEAVLFGVSAGVIALDKDKNITLFNRSASNILGFIDLSISTENSIGELLPGIHEMLAKAELSPGEVTDETLTLTHKQKTLSLHARITAEKKDDEIEGFIVTFDDITMLLSAQRTAAWADVARRVAHEIKNPLTPIQLSAERIKKKYLKFITEDQESFIRYTDTIAKHVGDIGKMVEEFVGFARMPSAVFANEDASSILKKALFSAQVANTGIEFRSYLPSKEISLLCDERQITQVLTNLLKNACESIESRLVSQPKSSKGVIITRLEDDGEQILISITDNGLGFPEGEISKMMEPYVTTRTKGMGLGLSIVRKIIEEHKGLMKIENNPDGGAKVTLSFPGHCDINAA
ncbi:MAG: PAS domain-containing sensor histidine kinase [Rickettsiales bacterium]|jgi:two-component system nitrogen regulation sensor histidine kinase NtrY|nr:PAS domain-containing sensor histidine kinase [Rickettsiales bacterium]